MFYSINKFFIERGYNNDINKLDNSALLIKYSLMFARYCRNKHYKISKLIWDLAKDVLDNVYILSNLCMNAHIEQINWFINLLEDKDLIIGNIDFQYIFNYCCSKNKFDTVKWLYEQSKIYNKKIDIGLNNHFAFKHCCRHAYLPLAKWLYKTSYEDDNIPINISMDNDYAIKAAIKTNMYDIIHWIASLDTDYKLYFRFSIVGLHHYYVKIHSLQDCIMKECHIDLLPNAPSVDINDICSICLDDEYTYWVKLNCNHIICMSCYMLVNTCPYKCHNCTIRKGSIIKKNEGE